ncbi:hypothetical protein pipiens_015651, partial [Culex pipiens pipiens]
PVNGCPGSCIQIHGPDILSPYDVRKDFSGGVEKNPLVVMVTAIRRSPVSGKMNALPIIFCKAKMEGPLGVSKRLAPDASSKSVPAATCHTPGT